MTSWRTWMVPAACGIALISVSPAAAHGLGQRFDLPIPLWLYLLGAGAAVALSFVIVALYARGEGRGVRYPTLSLSARGPGRLLIHPVVLFAVRATAAAYFCLVVAAGFIGNQDPFKNVAPVSVWVLWWVGFAYVSALLGDLWALVNPWRTLFDWAAAVWRWLRPGASPSRALPYPAHWGVWPSVALMLAFAWMELVWPNRDQPAYLAGAIALYSIVTWAGMARHGRDWLQRGEVFTVVFGLIARFALTEVRPGGEKADWRLRPPAAGLLTDRPGHPSMTAFVLLLLTSVTFDGLLETPFWVGIAEFALAAGPVVGLAGALGVEPYVVVASVGLLVFYGSFVGVYRLFAYAMAVAVGNPGRATEFAHLFVLSLVPISIAYHLAHYLSFLLVAGQFIIPLASDPFGWGWNLFGTKLYLIDIGVVDARFVWYLSVAAIVVGHVIAVYLAHVAAGQRLPTRKLALTSQYPMLLLMVGYTAISLWILAQPITEPPAP